MAKKEKDSKTNAMRILDNLGIPYEVRTYDVSDGVLDGVTAARRTGENPENVFKTLVTAGDDHNYYVFVIPVAAMLDLKACARAAGVHHVEMIPLKELFPLTGYIHGGCSPIGMKKKFATFYDETLEIIDWVLVSGGRIGTQVRLDPQDLLKATEGRTAPLTRTEAE